ncbi:hypothetical protein H257_18549 [Aphanomyces astaci]|uniref:Uncharacterized protein n=1 Tax=Aphanomyces astaci TaxID=112090 RepID=W4FCQ0_APHAT|nr:hypothetical protein H257_18549 [Aphanomyces astaci]ETV64586.1 hypothetical protein H257_18549 [Aphanomyces astaci]|eukprot:XP_009845942.1 hypothetical protein H257_18549 [Aphanomyces astaci]
MQTASTLEQSKAVNEAKEVGLREPKLLEALTIVVAGKREEDVRNGEALSRCSATSMKCEEPKSKAVNEAKDVGLREPKLLEALTIVVAGKREEDVRNGEALSRCSATSMKCEEPKVQ